MADPTLEQLVEAHAAARERLSRSAAAYAAAQAAEFGGWYDSDAIAGFADRVAARVQAGQRQTAAVTDSFLRRALTLMLRRPVGAAGPVRVTDLRAGVTPAGVYGRVADTYRYQVSLGNAPDKALAVAVQRARVLTETDLTLAFRAQAQRTLTVAAERLDLAPAVASGGGTDRPETFGGSGARVVLGYRRVIHPELSKGGTCGLCIAASDRLYSYEDLLPVHGGCHCTVLPAFEDDDPGLRINADDLSRLYADAGDTTSGRALKRTRYRVEDNGELGPVLVAAGQNFRDAADVAADSRR
jgi:hypothetical protein